MPWDWSHPIRCSNSVGGAARQRTAGAGRGCGLGRDSEDNVASLGFVTDAFACPHRHRNGASPTADSPVRYRTADLSIWLPPSGGADRSISWGDLQRCAALPPRSGRSQSRNVAIWSGRVGPPRYCRSSQQKGRSSIRTTVSTGSHDIESFATHELTQFENRCHSEPDRSRTHSSVWPSSATSNGPSAR